MSRVNAGCCSSSVVFLSTQLRWRVFRWPRGVIRGGQKRGRQRSRGVASRRQTSAPTWTLDCRRRRRAVNGTSAAKFCRRRPRPAGRLWFSRRSRTGAAQGGRGATAAHAAPRAEATGWRRHGRCAAAAKPLGRRSALEAAKKNSGGVAQRLAGRRRQAASEPRSRGADNYEHGGEILNGFGACTARERRPAGRAGRQRPRISRATRHNL